SCFLRSSCRSFAFGLSSSFFLFAPSLLSLSVASLTQRVAHLQSVPHFVGTPSMSSTFFIYFYLVWRFCRSHACAVLCPLSPRRFCPSVLTKKHDIARRRF